MRRPPDILTDPEQRDLAKIIEIDIDDMISKEHDLCEICGHKIHSLCNGANCDEPHFDPQNPPEPSDY